MSEELDEKNILQDIDLDSLSTIQKVLILQRLLKEMAAKTKIFLDNKEKMILKIDENYYKYITGAIYVKRVLDYLSNDAIKIKNRNYILIKDSENSLGNLYQPIYNFHFLLQNDISLIMKLIESCVDGVFGELSDFFVNFLYMNITNYTSIDERLILIIYLLFEKLIIKSLPEKIDINNNIPTTYLNNTLLYYILKSLTRKIDLRNFLSNILENFILRLENLRTTLSLDIIEVNKILNLREGNIYLTFISNLGSFKENEIHKKKKQFKHYKPFSKADKVFNNNLKKDFNILKRATKIELSDSIIDNEKNDNVKKIDTLNEKLSKNFLDDFEIINEKGEIIDPNKKETINFKKRKTKEEKEFKVKKDEKIHLTMEKLEIDKPKKSGNLNNKNLDLKLVDDRYQNLLFYNMNNTKGKSDNLRKPQFDENNDNDNDYGNTKIDIFFLDNDLTKQKIKEKLDIYKKAEKNNINSAMIEYLNNLIKTYDEHICNDLKNKNDLQLNIESSDESNNKNKINDGEIYSSLLYIQELKKIGSHKNQDNFLKLMKKIRINHRIISKIIKKIIQEISKNIKSFPYSIKCILKIIETLLYQKYNLENNNALTLYQIYLFKMNFLIRNIILPVLKEPNYNGLITANVISKITKDNLKIIYNIFDTMIKGELFLRKDNFSMTLYNNFIIETMPTIFEIFENEDNNIELPDYVKRLINKINTKEKYIDFDYGNLFENQGENIKFKCICTNFSILYIFFNLIKKNEKKLIEDNDNIIQKKVIEDLLKNQDIFIERYIQEKQEEQKGNIKYYYLTKVIYSPHFQNELDNISKDNFKGSIPKDSDDLLTSYKRCLIEVLNYANKIQYENFYDLTELKDEKTIKKNKTKKHKKEEEKKNKERGKNKAKTLRLSLIKIIESEKEDDADFKKIIFPQIRKNIILEMNSNINDSLSQKIIFCTNYLHLYMRNLPKEYIINNYSLLFDELIIQTKQNIKSLWSKILYDYYKKIKEAETLNILSSSFNSQIKNLENSEYIEYFYKKILLPSNFKIEKDSNDIISLISYNKEPSLSTDSSISALLNNKNGLIEDMILNFPDFTEYEKEYDDILEIEEKAEVPEALKNYFKEMKCLINKKDEPILRNLEDKDIKSIKLNLENYIFNKLYYKLFPSEYSEEDLFIYNKCKRLSFLKPENIIKDKNIINENLLNEASKYFEQLNYKFSPIEKIKCILKGKEIIENSISFSSGKGQLGFDDINQPIIYALLKANIKNLSTNLKYCLLYLNKEYSAKLHGKSLADVSLALEAIKSMTHSELIDITEEQFGKDDILDDNEK